MWRGAECALSVDAAAYEPLLGALSVNAIVCESNELVSALGSALLWKCGSDVGYLVSAIGLSLFTLQIDVSRFLYWFDEA